MTLADIWGNHSELTWALLGVAMVLLAVLLLTGVALLMRLGLYLVTERPGRHRDDDRLDQLESQFDDGDITAEQYTDRRVALGYGPRPG